MVFRTHRLDEFEDIFTDDVIEIATTIVLATKVMINECLALIAKLWKVSDERNIQKHISGEDDCAGRQSKSVVHCCTKSMGSSCESSFKNLAGFGFGTIVGKDVSASYKCRRHRQACRS